MNQTPNLTVIYGSDREGRLCDRVAGWVETRVDDDGRFQRQRLDPLELALPQRHPGDGHSDRGIARLRQRVELADAFLVVTPEYNHGYPAALKHLIDCVDTPWRLKPVAFVSYGGRSGGRHAVEQLRQVFNRLDAVTVSETLAFDQVWQRFDALGQLSAAERALTGVLDRLFGWAQALAKTRARLAFRPGPAL